METVNNFNIEIFEILDEKTSNTLKSIGYNGTNDWSDAVYWLQDKGVICWIVTGSYSDNPEGYFFSSVELSPKQSWTIYSLIGEDKRNKDITVSSKEDGYNASMGAIQQAVEHFKSVNI